MADDLLVFNQDAFSSADEIVVGKDGFTKTRASLGAMWTDMRTGRCDLGPDRCLGFLDNLHQESRSVVQTRAEIAAHKLESFLRSKLAEEELPSTPSTIEDENSSSLRSPEWNSRLSFLWYGISKLYMKEQTRLKNTIRTKIVQPVWTGFTDEEIKHSRDE